MSNLKVYEDQEKRLRFKSFSNDTALEIGMLLVEKAKLNHAHVAIDITVNGYQVFRYGFDGTNNHNEMWLNRKINTVNTVHKSSLHVGEILKETNEDLQEDWYLDKNDYAYLGGGFPIHVIGTGVIGSICVSGSPHMEDHQIIVDVLEEYLAEKEVNYRSEMIGLFGYPVDENPTVVIMEAAFKALGLHYRYNTTLVEPKDLEAAVAALRAFHMKGTHITIPHKIEVLQYLDKLSDAAELIGAVNTVYFDGDVLMGENTDGKGFITSLKDAEVEIKGKKAMILGAGGVARAMSVELAMEGIREIVIANIVEAEGENLVKLINDRTDAKAEFIFWDKALDIPEDVDILINGTSVGLYPDPNIPNINYDSLRLDMVVCDVIPNPLRTKFVEKVSGMGIKALDGFSMLVNQGAISFKLWTGVDAPIEIMREALKKSSN
ncbi:shikimate dehydrogenase [Chakrabartyella piscis]|uniref:shikimate dehydrogenase n=1 Tax=Chakrabartyella piscis TaxID=2918914 RepID=UPI00295836A9|nr:shikimate dehydrogenase [Chakrabartyella piscis]